MARNTGILPVSSNGPSCLVANKQAGKPALPVRFAAANPSAADWKPKLLRLRVAAVGGLSSAKRVDPRDIAADHQRVDVMRAFVCGHAFKVHQMSDHGVTIGDPGGA